MRNLKRRIWLLIILLLAACTQADQTPTPTDTAIATLPVLTPTEEVTEEVMDDLDSSAATGEETLIADRQDFEAERQALVAYSLIPMGIEDEDVIRAMQTVPRHMFVPDEFVRFAYLDMAMPIGYGQTISQPYIVAWMTELLELEPGYKVLEIGTGSGYQAAILAELGYVEVYSIEIIPELAERAKEDLRKAGYEGLNLKQDDGYYGWEEHAPFDAIIVTAAPDHMPLPLVQQLKDGGIMVIPIGPPGWYQTLWRITNISGELVAENLGPVGFVPFTGEGISSQQP
jgi:protein-L-isoaspartate(D-aspartate) O-methyltransferase